MLKAENTRVCNFMGAIRGMRNSWGSHVKSDSYESYTLSNKYDEFEDWEHEANVEGFVLGDKDRKLALTLVKAGASHGKFLRQIMVSFDLTAGNEFYKEFDTYKVGTVANSTSLMHTLGKRFLTEDDFSFDRPLSNVAKNQIQACNDAIQAWWDSGKKQGSLEWRDMQKSIPMGILYTRHVTLNYQVLRTMYFDRKNHRLAEWHDFCKWVESLPYSELITVSKTEKK